MNLRFQVVSKKRLFVSTYYSSKDSSFGYEDPCGDCSIMIDNGYTSLDVSLIDNTVCGISGYNPKKNWIIKKLNFPKEKALNGQLKIINMESIPIGSAVTYNRDWKTFFDPETGVVCIGTTNLSSEMVIVEFCTDTLAVLIGDKLIAIWILPVFTP